MMYEYLKKLNFKPNTVLDLGAWNGIWTREVKEFWPDDGYYYYSVRTKGKTGFYTHHDPNMIYKDGTNDYIEDCGSHGP